MEQPTSMKDVALYDNNSNGSDDIQTPSSAKVFALDEEHHPTCLQAVSMRVARSPCMFFWFFFALSFGMSMIGLIVGDFALSVEGEGWTTRGTLIADRQTQYHLVEFFGPALHSDTSGDVWMELINNVQLGFELLEDDDERRLEEHHQQEEPNSSTRLTWDEWMDWETVGHRFKSSFEFEPMKSLKNKYQKESTKNAAASSTPRELPFVLSADQKRRLQSAGGVMEGCDIGLYESDELLEESRLWPVFRARDTSKSFLDAGMIEDLCEIEMKTQRLLEENDLCIKCSGNSNRQCVPPYSLVFFARVTLTDGSGQDGFRMDCAELAQAWGVVEESVQAELAECIQDLTAEYNPERDGTVLPDSCGSGFFPSMVDEPFGTSGQALYTSSIFATRENDLDALYELADQFTQSSSQIRGAYDTQWEDFVNLSLDDQLLIDMSLAVGSAFVTVTAMIIHTRSPFLSLVGLLQIVLSFPLAYFFYTFVAGLEFFPFLNFIGVFVIFALGADDVFVAVDKWKNARLDHPHRSTAEIAAIALPDAASAMFLTTLTTAAAFFGTAVCPVAPIRCFAVFVGFLVILDYVMCILLVFPALCIYDYKREESNCCCGCGGCKLCCRRNENTEEGKEPSEKKESPIRRLLQNYYEFVHNIRWGLLAICGAALVASAIRAASISLPNSSDVRLYDESDNQYEQNFVWRKNILYNALQAQGGSRVSVIWGVTPADTGDQNNPETWSQLVLDDSFDPSREEAQIYFRDFCDRFFSEEFAGLKETGFVCAFNRFDSWLQEQSVSDEPEDIYVANCAGATELPLPENEFDACISSWAQVYETDDYSILSHQGKVKIIYIPFNGRVRFDSAFEDLENEWNLIEDWFKNENANVAPSSANRGYFTSEDYWWYDTNGVMLQTAFASSGIAMAAAAAVILFSSRSFVLTVFATVTVGYVLTSVIATLVALGWSLGFLEAILFAILIGISVDFVIHFSHAYTHLPGHAPREDRTLHALITMGPSILAAAFTTFAAALVMLFTIITFFEKFAVVLFLTVVQALVGSFVVFITLVDCVGPADPSYIFDHVVARVYGVFGLEYEIQGKKKYDPNGETD